MREPIIVDRYQATHDIHVEGPVETYEGIGEAGADVAIKIVHIADEAIEEQFKQDVETAIGIVHSNVARTFGWGPHKDDYYVVREWVPGMNLSTLRQQGAIPPAKAAHYAVDACSALAALHARGIVHKDVRPETLVLNSEGTIKLIDVGIPRPGAVVPEDAAPPHAAQFISPEQASGQEVGPASDTYSLGVVLYYLTTGRAPFDAATAREVAREHVNTQALAPRRRNPQISPALEAVITRAMSKNPERRYASALEMRDDLQRALAPEIVVAAMPSREPQGRTWPWILGGLGAALILAVAVALTSWIMATSPVPDLANATPAQAQQRLAADLRLGTLSYQQPVPAGVTEGTIISQSPAPGARARSGTTVDIVVAGVARASVPNLLGQTQTAAMRAITSAQLVLGGVQQQFNARVSAGLVAQQTPAAGTQVPVDTPVQIVVSRGPEAPAVPGNVTVPNVLATAEADAIASLGGAGLSTVITRAFSSSVQSGHVVSQGPAPGVSVTRGSSVSIVISRGTGNVAVPNVIGLNQTSAANTLGKAGFTVRRVYIKSTVTPGRVIEQDPDVGVSAPAGSTVTITVSTK